MRLLKGYFQCLVLDPSHKYGRTHPGSRIRDGYVESRYDNKYPKHKHAAYEALSMQGDEYSRSKYRHSYLERAHDDSCPECIRGDHNSSAYQSGHYSSGNKAGHRYQCENGEEFAPTSGSEKGYYNKTVSACFPVYRFYLLLDVDCRLIPFLRSMSSLWLQLLKQHLSARNPTTRWCVLFNVMIYLLLVDANYWSSCVS